MVYPKEILWQMIDSLRQRNISGNKHYAYILCKMHRKMKYATLKESCHISANKIMDTNIRKNNFS